MGILHLFVLIIYFLAFQKIFSFFLISPPSGVFFTSLVKKGRFMGNAVFNYLKFSSVIQSCQTLCDPMDCSSPGFPVHHQLLELAQSYVH